MLWTHAWAGRWAKSPHTKLVLEWSADCLSHVMYEFCPESEKRKGCTGAQGLSVQAVCPRDCVADPELRLATLPASPEGTVPDWEDVTIQNSKHGFYWMHMASPSLSQKIIKSSHCYIRDVCNQEHEMSSIWTLKWNQEGKMGLIITSLPQITLPIRNNG